MPPPAPTAMATMAVGAASTMTAAIELLLGPLHLILYSSLLGTELYQSFVMTKVCFRALPKPAFRTLQKHVFPVYFRGQALLLLLTAATVPPVGPLSLVARKAHWIPFAVAGAMAALNLLVYGPRTQQAMVERAHQETRDKNQGRGDAAEDASPEMRVLNRNFSRNHAASIHLNLISIGATIWWGVILGSRLDFGTF